jgi:hypothetical protein
MAPSFSGGGSRRKPPTLGKQLVNFITWRPSSVRKHFNLLLENHRSKWDQTWQEGPGAIKASDWLKFLMISFSDTTWRMELKIVMNDHCKLLTKCWEICKTNFFSRTTGWIGTIHGRNVPDKVLINCCYFLFRSVIQYGCQGP